MAIGMLAGFCLLVECLQVLVAPGIPSQLGMSLWPLTTQCWP